jgi:hypothetical protein
MVFSHCGVPGQHRPPGIFDCFKQSVVVIIQSLGFGPYSRPSPPFCRGTPSQRTLTLERINGAFDGRFTGHSG